MAKDDSAVNSEGGASAPFTDAAATTVAAPTPISEAPQGPSVEDRLREIEKYLRSAFTNFTPAQ